MSAMAYAEREPDSPRYPHTYTPAVEFRPRPLREIAFAADLIHPAPCALCRKPFSDPIHLR